MTTTVPIVQATSNDLVAEGFAASLSRPGGNVTGLTFFLPELMAKRLELIKEVVPSLVRAGVLLLRGHTPANRVLLDGIGPAAKR